MLIDRKSQRHRPINLRSGFTLVELLIVIGVIVVLIALLLPSVASVRARARSVEAQSNLAQLGLALQAANRNRSTPVKATEGSRAWMEQIRPFLEGENNEALFVSPADPNAEQRKDDDIPSFAVNNQMHRMGSGDGNKIVMLDFEEEGLNGKEQDGVFEVTPNSNGDPWTPEVDGNWQSALDAAGQRQGGNVNVLRHDGSVSSESADDLITDHPAASADDWVPWRSENRWQPTTSEDNGDIDSDDDGIANDQDNCPDQYNPSQGPCEEDGTDGSGSGGGGGGGGTDPTNDLGHDDDEDGISSNGDGSDTAGDNPCGPGQSENCDDNCPDGYNPNQTDTNGNGDYCDDYQETNCEFPMPELDGWHIHVKALSGGEADYPINDLNNPWVRLATDQPDDDCLVNIEIEDAGGTDFDSRVRLERLSDGNILLEYSWIAGDGTYFWHWVRDPEGNVRIGGENGERCPANSCGTPHVIGTVIIPGNQGMEYCNCNPGTAAPEPPDGVASWKGYNLGGGEHIGSSDLDDLVFERFLPSRASGGIDSYTNEEYETNDDPLWQQLYFSAGGGFTLAIPVDNPGTYRVTFYAVHVSGYDKGRQDIALEGVTAVSAWDLGPPLGGIYGTNEPRPLQRTVNVVVNDDTLDVAVTPNEAWIETYPDFKYVMLSAIKVEELE